MVYDEEGIIATALKSPSDNEDIFTDNSKSFPYWWQRKRVVLVVCDAGDGVHVVHVHDVDAGDDDGHHDYCSHFGCYS